MNPVASLLVVDKETGGLSPREACTTEVAACMLYVYPGAIVPVAAFHTRMKPDLPVGDKAAEVSGYSPEAWVDAPDIREGLAMFTDWASLEVRSSPVRPMWTGCNPLFDLKFYNSDCDRLDIQKISGLSYRVIDVQSMCFPLLLSGEISSLKLEALRTWAGRTGKQTHTADGDVEDTVAVIQKFIGRFPAHVISDR